MSPDAHAHAHPHHPALAHHFDNLEQQQEVASIGMWVFLATEVMFFGGLFMAYILYRTWYPEAFTEGSHHLDVTLGTINTAVLIGSSLTMALAVRAAQLDHRRTLVTLLGATMVLGLVFLGIKAFEYYHKFEEGLIPGALFTYESPVGRSLQVFFSLYFTMTGLHAVHMIIGIGVLSVMLVMATRGRFVRGYYSPIEVTGLYWHFVDIVWIFLFPLLYLIGRH